MWDKVTLFKFQEMDKIIHSTKYSEEDKTLFCTCIYFGITEWQFEQLPFKKGLKMVGKVGKDLQQSIKPVAKKRIGKYLLNYSIDKMTFGQYIEIAYFLQMGVLPAAHLLLASAATSIFDKATPEKYKIKHSKKAEYFLNKPIEKTLGSALLLIENFNTFNKQYKGLFGLKNSNEQSDIDVKKEESDPFNKQYGWIFSATQVAEHERISLDQSFMLPITQALNDLAYLKSLNKYREQQLKKK